MQKSILTLKLSHFLAIGLFLIAGCAIVLMFGNLPLAQADDCTTPTDGLLVMADTTLCAGSYSLSDPDEDGIISIGADNITLDCNNASLTGGGSGWGIQNNGFDGVTIKNCSFANYNKGILIQNNSSNNIIRNNTINNLQGTFSIGIHVINSSGAEIFNNAIDGSEDGNGILLSNNTTNSYVHNNNSVNNGRHGIIVEDTSSNNEVYNNTTSNNSLAGGYGGYGFGQGTFNNYFHNNISDGDHNCGFNIRSTTGDVISNNTIVNGRNVALCVFSDADDIGFANNIIYNNSTGVKIDVGVSYSFFYNNVYGNKIDYQGLAVLTGLDGNISQDPLFADSASPAGPDGIFWTPDDGLRLSELSPSVDAGDPAMTDPDGSRIDMGAYGGTELATVVPTCIKPTKGLKLNQDTNLCPGEYSFNLWAMEAALKVDADNITITCQNTIITNPFKLGIGLYNDNHDNVVIQGCTFKNLNFGMIVRGSDKVMLRDVELTENKRGIQFAQSQDSLIRNSRIRDNNLVDIAVYNGDLTIDAATNESCPDIFTFFGEVEISDGLLGEADEEEILGLPASTKLSPDFY